ncbi:MAG TPA: serine--tRNA ligase [Verrucomicrobiae bacterium]|nr:serine--tRNA ligase [Verrucomicrobiae bacterium]
MLDIKLIRESPDLVRQRLALRGSGDEARISEIAALDEQRRKLVAESDTLKAQRNQASKEIGAAKSKGQDTNAQMAAMKEVGDKIAALDARLSTLDAQLQDILLTVPNLPHESVPIGKDPADNPEVRRWGELPKFSFQPKPHWELGEKLGILDFPRAAKISGSGFILYKGAGARLERALINWMLDLHTREHGYTEVFPPFLISRNAMIGTGQLPKFEEDMYRLRDEEMYLAPTAEVPVANIHREEILREEQLPIYYCAYTPCFRREAGAAGKETRGMIRVHQFDKVEMIKFVKPEASYDELEKMVANAEHVLQLLGLHYRSVLLCTGDTGFASAKTYDVEVWAPGQNAYLEVSSCSNTEEFQARRANIRFKGADGKNRFVHILNGSGTALARLYVALLETYQQPDGSVKLPEVLLPYMGGLKEIQPQ